MTPAAREPPSLERDVIRHQGCNVPLKDIVLLTLRVNFPLPHRRSHPGDVLRNDNDVSVRTTEPLMASGGKLVVQGSPRRARAKG